MSSSQPNAFSVSGLEFLSRLESYETEVAGLINGASGADALHLVRLRLDAMRTLIGTLPGLSVPWAELLICHFELAHTLWKVQNDHLVPRELFAVRERHERACVRLRNQCSLMLKVNEGGRSGEQRCM